MPFSPQTLEEKPYNRCINCAHIGKNCDGPNFLAMTTERWCEWCRLRKDYLGWTNARVAELAGVSKISVDRIMSVNVKDLRNTTMQAVTKALVNGSWGQYPCATAVQEPLYIDNPALVAKCEQLQADISQVRAEDQRKIDFLMGQVKFKEEQMAAKDRIIADRYDFIKAKDRTIRLLSVLLAISTFIIISALVADKLNPDLGFIWRAAALGWP